MRTKRLKNLLLITVMIAATGIAMAYSSTAAKLFFPGLNSAPPEFHGASDGLVRIAGHLVQSNVLQGSEGRVSLSLTLQADDVAFLGDEKAQNVDIVIVLDRSGSMQGRKIEDARRAVVELLSSLSANDRFALVTYSDGVQILSGLMNVTDGNREKLVSAVQRVYAGGGTNLGAGLQTGINLLVSRKPTSNSGKIILISDGLANKGITDARALGGMAAIAVEKEFAVSTVGVGADFNEHLMTTIADLGTGNYYYLENPEAFAEVFQKEFYFSRAAVATHLSVHIPVQNGINLVDVAGYPIKFRDGFAVFYPGSLRSGQSRNLFLTLQVPTSRQKTFDLGPILVRYQRDSQSFEVKLDESFKIACVRDPDKVYSSIDKTRWSQKVIQEDFNRLKEEVAADIKAGEKERALDKIEKYHDEQKAVNAVVGSAPVAENLDKDLNALRSVVEDTFQGAPAEVMQKQKAGSKALQYEGYSGRRQ